MFWLLLSRACSVPGISPPRQPGDAVGQQLRIGQRDTPSHKTERSATTPPHPKPKEKQHGGVAFPGGCCLETGGTTKPAGGGEWLALHHLIVPSPHSLCSPHQTISHLLNHLLLIKPSLSPPVSFSLHSLSHPVVGGGNKWPCGCFAAVGGHSMTYRKNRERNKSTLWFLSTRMIMYNIYIVQYLVTGIAPLEMLTS